MFSVTSQIRTKDKTATFSQSFTVHGFVCPGCSANYVMKTIEALSRNLKEMLKILGVAKIVVPISILMNKMMFMIYAMFQNSTRHIFLIVFMMKCKTQESSVKVKLKRSRK